MKSLHTMKNSVGSVVIEILSYRQKTLLLYIVGLGAGVQAFSFLCQMNKNQG